MIVFNPQRERESSSKTQHLEWTVTVSFERNHKAPAAPGQGYQYNINMILCLALYKKFYFFLLKDISAQGRSYPRCNVHPFIPINFLNASIFISVVLFLCFNF
ncbi:hypothetical protein EGW08_023758 [Elysia chlorotica]|uniref:Uncharacterized protein n=1 Tax=Elysia chlorotica TaxID=188477 RepID=A0A433SI37_ELYCH|nr:hypothetical protein EGW08_023758 [Elysia chlorotica]